MQDSRQGGPSTPSDADLIDWTWEFWAREQQLPPDGDWSTWLMLAGRGGGKTRTGAEWVISRAQEFPGSHGALVAASPADARDVMVEGVSGILACSPPWFRPKYEPSKRRLTWPNGAWATTYSAHNPDELRGPQHHWAWGDELAKWRFPDTWDQLQLGLRLGTDPRCVITTTPRATPLIRALVDDSSCHVDRWATFANAANLAPRFISELRKKYEGTTLGQQELYAQILDVVAGAIWARASIESARVAQRPTDLLRIVVAVDPPATEDPETAEAGIVAAGIAPNGDGYVLDDRSTAGSPLLWASQAVILYDVLRADALIVEVNNGGDMVEYTVRAAAEKLHANGLCASAYVNVVQVRATRGKRTRAEPISALYEQGRVHHVGMLAELEDQLCTWDAGTGQKSPDRLDALVWALTNLMIDEGLPASVPAPRTRTPLSRWDSVGGRGF